MQIRQLFHNRNGTWAVSAWLLILPALQKKTLADMFHSQEMEAQKESEITGHSAFANTCCDFSPFLWISHFTGKGKRQMGDKEAATQPASIFHPSV